MLFLDDLFAMGGGYVLDFSDRTISQFFAEELNCDIDDPAYAVNGRSKGKRLRCFLQTVDIPTVVRVLKALWDYREAGSARDHQLLSLINRLEGKPEAVKPVGQAPAQLEQKAAWTRGLFISNSGFTEGGLAAFGRGKRVICMDGLDMHDTMHREIPLNHVLDRKKLRFSNLN